MPSYQKNRPSNTTSVQSNSASTRCKIEGSAALFAPAIDVSGDWTITGYLNWFWVYQTPEWPHGQEDLNARIDRAPDSHQHRQLLIVGPHPRDYFPTEPAWPGWPRAVK